MSEQHTDAQDDADLELDDDRDRDGEAVFRRARGWKMPPNMISVISATEISRLRSVEVVARELADIVVEICDGKNLRPQREYRRKLARARAVGLLPEATK